MSDHAGLLVRRAGERLFIGADVARHLVPSPRLSRLPWDSVQMALVGGEVVAVVELGEPSGILVLCDISGQAVALSGLVAEEVGFWPETAGGVSVNGEQVPALDLGAAVAAFQTEWVEQKEAP
ncbi:MAG TPA: hypothetical protein VGM44_05280 [Polyangiaceae bacterium]|jgi:hypothetical protein